jgi:hypothetical protein
LLLVGGVASADKAVGNAQWLHDKWTSTRATDMVNSMDLAVYDGFVIATAQVGENATPRAIEIPAGTTMGQIFGVVGTYLENHPDEWNSDAGTVVLKALQRVYPCKR